MRVYMRDRRKEEAARREAEAKQRKLKVIEKLLVDWYVWIGQKEEFTAAKPNVTYHPQLLKHHVTLPVIVKKPVVDKETGERLGTITKKKNADFSYVDPKPAGYARTIEVVPDSLKATVNQVRWKAKAEGIQVNDIYIKRDIQRHLENDFTELLGEAFFYKMSAVFEKYKKTKDHRLKVEWLTMRQMQKDSETALEDVIVNGIVNHKTDEQILGDAHTDDKASSFFSTHYLAELDAKQLIEKIRKILP